MKRFFVLFLVVFALPLLGFSNVEQPPAETTQEVAAMNSMSNVLLSEANVHMGKKYILGRRGPNSFDCSGFVEYCYKTALGITPPRIIGGYGGGAQYQYNACKKITEEELIPGDLVFFGSSTKHITHVGIYVSPDKMINAMNSRKGVCLATISRFKPRFVAYGRVEGFADRVTE